MYFTNGDWLYYLQNESWYIGHLPFLTLLAGLYCHKRNRLASNYLGPTFRGPIGHR
jgi:hypothetical protein